MEEALRHLVRRREKRASLSDMIGLGWEGDLAVVREGARGPIPVIVVDRWVWIDSGTTTGISTGSPTTADPARTLWVLNCQL